MGDTAPVVKRIVVLANSFKHDPGRCIAGREVSVAADGWVSIGGWIRPVSDAGDGELYPDQCRLQDGQLPRLLEIIDIPFKRVQGNQAQPENRLIDGSAPWHRVGSLSPIHLPELAERSAHLWPDDGFHTDRVSISRLAAAPPAQSLYLLHLRRCRVAPGGAHGYRLRFSYHGSSYSLKITDPAFEPRFSTRLFGHDELLLEDIYACVSLGRPFNGYHYKLVAAVIPAMTGLPLFTVGHSNLTTEAFIEVLRLHGVDAIADVRSQPYSTRYHQFSRDTLARSLEDAGMTYVFLGKELGARRDEPECYVDGQARYERIAACPAFKQGLRRVVRGASKYRLALLCAEQDPLVCHRTILISRRLWPLGFSIKHILPDGRLETQAELERRLMEEERLNPDQPPLFSLSESPDEANPLDRAYAARGGRIAYRMDRDGRDDS